MLHDIYAVAFDTFFTTSAGIFILGVGQNWLALRPLRGPTFVHNVTLYEIITDNEKLNFSDKTLQYSHFIYHKSHTDCPDMRRRRPWSDAGD